MLNGPIGIFVDKNINLYLADCYNNRIQLFSFGAYNGTIVAGNGASSTILLQCPSDVKLDGNGYLFIVDQQNSRIIGSGPAGFQCIAGCTRTSGPASNQLNQPVTLSFDRYGNLYIADMLNNRIQKFLVSKDNCRSYNQPKFCSNATWDANAITFFESKITAPEPQDIFTNTNNTVYLITRDSGDIFITPEQNNDTLTLNISHSSKSRNSLFIMNNNDIYVEASTADYRIDKWISNTTSLIML
ncbi:hypothetical protein I4U23_003934 [Adineta vaga]|nr:hypothetical protein I4U23_003934 [Adineta vaga]